MLIGGTSKKNVLLQVVTSAIGVASDDCAEENGPLMVIPVAINGRSTIITQTACSAALSTLLHRALILAELCH